MKFRPCNRAAAPLLFSLFVLCWATAAQAVPSFARQTGMSCEACHTIYPELTHFGRMFKASGYVIDNLKQVKGVTPQREEILELAGLPPLSLMVQASYSSTAKAQPQFMLIAAR